MKWHHTWLACALTATTALAHAELSQVRVWAAACATCHGTDGRAQSGMAILAGQSSTELTTKLMEFKSGTRPATLMHQITKGYSDEQLAALAKYFAGQVR